MSRSELYLVFEVEPDGGDLGEVLFYFFHQGFDAEHFSVVVAAGNEIYAGFAE